VQKAGSLLAGLADRSIYEKNGFQYISNQIIRPGKHVFKETEISNEGNNEQLGEELWTLSEHLINQKLGETP
jgi:protochlorophyllide reductase